MPATPEPWRARAFGLEIEASFAAAGLPVATGPAEGPRTVVTVVPEGEIEERWGAREAPTTRLLEERLDDLPDAARSIDHAPGTGYRLFARHFGVALVDDEGAAVRCAPPAQEPWSWQRFLVGRVLPWAAVLRGREVLHASAVTVGGRALAMVGASGAGKTSLAAHLIDGGAGCLTDDVLALDGEGDGAIRAHPGVGILCVRTAEREAMVAQGRWDALGVVLGDSGKTYVEVAREPSAIPLGAVYFLARGPGAEGIERIERPDPRLLLGSTFVAALQSPGRLRRQLDLCADLAAGVPMFRVAVGAGDGGGAAGLARALRDHAERHGLA